MKDTTYVAIRAYKKKDILMSTHETLKMLVVLGIHEILHDVGKRLARGYDADAARLQLLPELGLKWFEGFMGICMQTEQSEARTEQFVEQDGLTPRC